MNKLRIWRKRRKLNAAEFAQMLTPAPHKTLITHWERGTKSVTLDYALQIAKITRREVTPEDCLAMKRSVPMPDEGVEA